MAANLKMTSIKHKIATTTPKQSLSIRWNAFAKDTTFHGVKELSKNQSLVVKLIWALIILGCTCLLGYQTYDLINAYTSDTTITTVTTLKRDYPTPRVMIAIPTSVLMRSERQIESDLPELDPEALLYARSTVESVVYIPDDVKNFDADRAKRKFDDYLVRNNVTWAQALEPYILDVESWLISRDNPNGQDLRVGRRLIWYPFTYHVMEPTENGNDKSIDQSRWPLKSLDKASTIGFNWSSSPLGNETHVTLVSYELVNDNYRIKKGDKSKLVFDITSHKRLSSSKKPCDKFDNFRYRGYDEMACKEQCLLETILKRYPNSCLHNPDVQYSLLQFYPKNRPCSFRESTYVSLNGGKNFTKPIDYSFLPRKPDVTKSIEIEIVTEIEQCQKTNCVTACDELTVKYQLNLGVLTEDQAPDVSQIILEWPAFEGVVVFEELLAYTILDVISQWGGLAGLCLGASLMSFFEIVFACCCCTVGNEN